MLRNIIAMEYDGFAPYAFSITCEVPDGDFDLISAVRKACTDFCKTKEGSAVYEYNCHSFNWGDFATDVPNSFCERHGFKKADDLTLADEVVDLNTHLVNDFELDKGDEE